MSGDTTFSHICEAWQPENYAPLLIPSSPYDEFLIEIYANFMYVSVDEGPEDGPVREHDSSLSPTVYKSFRQRREHLTKDSTSWSTISSMLSQVDVPYHVQPFMIRKISEAARVMASASENMNCRTIPMVVSIRVVVPVDEESESSSEEENDRSCIEGLEKVRLQKGFLDTDNYECVICLEEIPIGNEAISMPCSHIYHEDCIVSWLQRSSLCPLCRFHIPPRRSDPEEY